MIYGQLRNWKQHASTLSKTFEPAFAFIEKLDPATAEMGRHEIDGDRMYAIVSQGETVPEAERKAEVHNAYMDIHCVLQGTEWIGYAPRDDRQTVTEDLMETGDALLFEQLHDEGFLKLNEGDYTVLYPSDIHRPMCTLQEPATVRKVVIKIRMDSFS